MAVSFLPSAEAEMLDAADRYDAESRGLGSEFLSEVEGTVARIIAFPEHGALYLEGTRRVKVPAECSSAGSHLRLSTSRRRTIS
jgi:hypothetical protein